MYIFTTSSPPVACSAMVAKMRRSLLRVGFVYSLIHLKEVLWNERLTSFPASTPTGNGKLLLFFYLLQLSCRTDPPHSSFWTLSPMMHLSSMAVRTQLSVSCNFQWKPYKALHCYNFGVMNNLPEVLTEFFFSMA